jgi:hypothetical protein
MYWCLGCFSTDTAANSRSGGLFRSFETMGQAISYSINSRSGNKLSAFSDSRHHPHVMPFADTPANHPRAVPLYINAALLVLTVPCQFILIRMVRLPCVRFLSSLGTPSDALATDRSPTCPPRSTRWSSRPSTPPRPPLSLRTKRNCLFPCPPLVVLPLPLVIPISPLPFSL